MSKISDSGIEGQQAETAKGQVFLMTDKEKTKDCPCTYAGCFNVCRVNTFYAPSKAKCPPHGGKAMTRGPNPEEMDFQSVDVKVVETIEVEISPNYKVQSLMCPICDSDEPLEILACTEGGHIDFGCQGCQTIVSIMFNFRSAQLRSIPKELAKVVKAFNIKQVGSMDASVMHEMNKFGSGLRAN